MKKVRREDTHVPIDTKDTIRLIMGEAGGYTGELLNTLDTYKSNV